LCTGWQMPMRVDDATAVILCGGDSRRMGRDKANLLLHDRTLLDHALHLVCPLFPRVLLAVRRPRAGWSLPQVYDVPTCAGPMAGVAAALAQARTPWVFVLACDMPFVSGGLIRCLAELRAERDAVVPVWQRMPQPLVGFYHRRALSRLRQQMRTGLFGMIRLLESLNVDYVCESLWGGHPYMLKDLDTPEDLRWAWRIMSKMKREGGCDELQADC